MAAALWVVTAEGNTGGRAPDLDEVRRALAVLADDAHGVQLHADLRPHWDYRTFRGGDLDGMAAWVADRPTAAGVYYTLNPCSPFLEKHLTNEAAIHRRWLLIDVDRHKDPGTLKLSATDQEHEAARANALRILHLLTDLGWPAPVLVCSGNGFHLLYRVMLANDEPARDLVRDFLKALAGLWPTVGKECHDARRVAKLPGTWAQKGPDTADRPHRMARLLRVPDPLDVAADALIRDTTERLKAMATAPAEPPPAPPAAGGNGTFTLHATSGEGGEGRAWAQRAFELEVGKMAMAQPGGLNVQLDKSGAALGNLVPHLLGEQEVFDALLAAARSAGADDPRKDEDTLRRAIARGKTTPRWPPGMTPPASSGGAASAQTSPGEVRKPGWKRPTIYALPDLLGMELPEPRWAVPGMMSEGLTILAGKPKLGKSWAALNLGLTIAAGGKALGTTQVVPGDVLYLSLEDRLRRVQDRARKSLRGLQCGASSRLRVAVEWPRQDQGGMEELEEWLRAAERPSLVVIDVWARFRSPVKAGGSAYDQDYLHAASVKSVADRYGCSLLIVHHCKKAAAEDVVDEISGTLGLAGAADGLLVLTRSRGENEATLFITGRDVEQQELALEFDPTHCVWKSLGSAAERTESQLKGALIAVMKANPGVQLSLTELADRTRTPEERRGYMRCLLSRMAEQELIRRTGAGRYCWPVQDPEPDEASF